MDDSFNLARHVARFMSLLMRQPDDVDQQKLELRAIALMTTNGTLRLSARGAELVANGIVIPQALTGVGELCAQLVGHDVKALEINQGASPGELLAIGRILAEPLTVDRALIHDRLRAAAVKTVVVTLPERVELDAAAPHAAAPDAPGSDAPRSDAPAAAAEPPPGSSERVPFILQRAARGGDGQPLVPHFEEVAFAIEQATREGRTQDAMAVFMQLISHEPLAVDGEVRRQFLLTIRRLVKPAVLHPITRMIVADPERETDVLTILSRCSSDGSDAMIDQYGRAATAAERALYLAALDKLPSADASLTTMLADARSHVARLAADLLGLRRPVDGDTALADQLTADDHRVRRSVVRALGRYGTAFSVDAIARALTDPVVEVRLEAVAALVNGKSPRAGEIIRRRMADEESEEVQIAMLGALGKVGTSDAVATLAKAAEPGSRLFSSRRGASVRVAAVRALAETRSAAAISALQSLANDKEREVRETAARATAR